MKAEQYYSKQWVITEDFVAGRPRKESEQDNREYDPPPQKKKKKATKKIGYIQAGLCRKVTAKVVTIFFFKT